MYGEHSGNIADLAFRGRKQIPIKFMKDNVFGGGNPGGDSENGLINSASKHLTLKCSTTADVPIIQTDPPKLQQVLYNFLSNAIKFSPPGGQVELKAAVEFGDQIRISVTDQPFSAGSYFLGQRRLSVKEKKPDSENEHQGETS